MSIDRKRLALALLGSVVLGGCAFDPQTGKLVEPHPELGEASRQTFMAQVVNPDPQYPDKVPQSSGVQSERALEAYREGKVEQPKTPNPTVSVGGSGNGGSGSSGSR
jgi:hypothetical protein